MADVVTECKAIGRQFEDLVANDLRQMGFTVYQNLYVPYRPGDSRVTEIDIVAVRESQLITVECKYISGEITGTWDDKAWLWKGLVGEHKIANPLRQSYSHKRALMDNLFCDVVDIVVVSDGVYYNGPIQENVMYYSSLKSQLPLLLSRVSFAQIDSKLVCRQLQQWSQPNDAVRQNHIVGVNRAKNGDVGEKINRGVGSPYFCVMIGEIFYSFTDIHGVPWGVEDVAEAALYDTEEAANKVLDILPDAEVCTLALGRIEALSDLPDELDELAETSPAEYAYEIGARPW